jgi:hypothetical protein
MPYRAVADLSVTVLAALGIDWRREIVTMES